MRDYPRRVYLSTSWDGSHRLLSEDIVQHLARNDLTVVGDHPDYKRDDPFKRPWPQRADRIIRDCGGLVAVFPEVSDPRVKQHSKYNMFPEVLSAFRHGIPVLLFIQTGVPHKCRNVNGGFNLQFGDHPSLDSLCWDDIEPIKDDRALEELLRSAGTLQLRGASYLQGPCLIPSDRDLASDVDAFAQKHVKDPRSTYVFNILPFSMRQREHRDIARAVFEETGLPCYISLDQIDISSGMRRQWRELVEDAEFCIADFSMIRDACLFEIGVFFGHHKKIFVVSKGGIPRLPFGPDDLPVLPYESLPELRKIVRERCCAKYKRKVYNLALNLPDGVPPGGLPVELYHNTSGPNVSRRIAWAGWLVSATLGLLIWWLLLMTGATNSPAAGVGILVSFVFGFASSTRELRQTVEERWGDKSRVLVGVGVLVFLVATLLLVMSYNRKSPPEEKELIEAVQTDVASPPTE